MGELARLDPDPAVERGAGDGTRDPTDAASAVPWTSSIGLVGLYGGGAASSAIGVAEVIDAGGASVVVGATVGAGTLSGSTCMGWSATIVPGIAMSGASLSSIGPNAMLLGTYPTSLMLLGPPSVKGELSVTSRPPRSLRLRRASSMYRSAISTVTPREAYQRAI